MIFTVEELNMIDHLKTEADLRSEQARATEDLDQRVLLHGEAIGIRAMVIDLLDFKHRKDAPQN
jgi:hypothetical protein